MALWPRKCLIKRFNGRWKPWKVYSVTNNLNLQKWHFILLVISKYITNYFKWKVGEKRLWVEGERLSVGGQTDLGRNHRNLQTRSHYVEEIWRSFICTVRPTVHTNPSRKRSSSKTLFKPVEFENGSFSFSSGQKKFWERSFLKTMPTR